MSTLSATLIWDELRHPLLGLRKHLSKHRPVTPDQSSDGTATDAYACQSPERMERIAAYARSGYFHMDYTAGMFVVPLDVPPE